MLLRAAPRSRIFAALAAVLIAADAGGAPVEIVSPEFRGALQPQAAVAADGRLHVVFGKGDSIFHTSSFKGGAFSAPVEVGKLDKLGLGRRRGPRIAATENFGVTVTAISMADGLLHSWVSMNQGRTWSGSAILNTVPTSAREGLHAMAADGRGGVAVVWLDLRSGGMELWSRTSWDGGSSWEPEVRVYASPDGHICECCHPSVAFGPNHEIAAMWRNWLGGSRDLWLAVSSDSGRTFGPAQKLGEGTWKLSGCPMDGGAITYHKHALTTAWRRETTLFLAPSGQAETKLAESALQPVLASAGGKLFRAWEQHNAIFWSDGHTPAQRLSAGHFPSLAPIERDGVAYVVYESEVDGKPSIFAEILR